MKFLQTMQYFIVSFFYLFSLSVASDDFMLRELLFYTSFEYLFNKYFLILIKVQNIIYTFAQILQNVGIFGSMPVGVFGGLC
ncbi:MAG: hypothetical protein II322_00755 [Alistipes sp.]|jgi:hypothetical protein|nr:hypothetical protein [Alistipes sp.]